MSTTRLVVCKNDSMVCLLPEWIEDLDLAQRIAKYLGYEDELENSKNGAVFHVEHVRIATDCEIGKILCDLLKD